MLVWGFGLLMIGKKEKIRGCIKWLRVKRIRIEKLIFINMFLMGRWAFLLNTNFFKDFNFLALFLFFLWVFFSEGR